MYTVVECVKAKSEWYALTVEERQAFYNRLFEKFGKVAERNQLPTLPSTMVIPKQGTDYDYIFIFQVQDLSAVDLLVQTNKDIGWYTYFEHQVIAGAILTMEDFVQHMIHLQR